MFSVPKNKTKLTLISQKNKTKIFLIFSMKKKKNPLTPSITLCHFPLKKIIILCLFNWTKKKKKKTEKYIPVLYFVCRKTVVSAVSRTKQRRTAEVAKGDRKSHYHHLTLSVI